MEKRYVIVQNEASHAVGIANRDLAFRRRWDRKGVKKRIEFDLLVDLLYDRGVENLFKEGYLSIPNKQDRIDLGLETEDEELVTLTQFQQERLLKSAPIEELETTLKKLSRQQKNELAQLAVDKKLGDYNRWELLSKETGMHIVEMIKNAEE